VNPVSYLDGAITGGLFGLMQLISADNLTSEKIGEAAVNGIFFSAISSTGILIHGNCLKKSLWKR
jgi:hypothetical protein